MAPARSGVLLERSDDLARDPLPPVGRADIHALDLRRDRVERAPAAARRRFSLYVGYHSAGHAVKRVVLLVFFRDLAPARVEIRIQFRDQRRKVSVGHIDKFKFDLRRAVQLFFKAQAVVRARRAAVIRHHAVAQLEIERRRIRSRARGLEDRVRIAVLRRVALDRADHRAGNALPPVFRQDVNALDLHAALVDPFPAAATRGLAVDIDDRAAAEQMRVVVFRVPLMYLAHDFKIVLVQLRREHEQVGVFRIDKFDLHPASLLQIKCHQHRILGRRGVEIPAHAHLPEARALIQRDRGRVGSPCLERDKRQSLTSRV